MSVFTGDLTITELGMNWRLWRLEQPLIYEVGSLGSGQVVTVPPGFVTDGASVPRLLWAFLPSWGKYSRAAVLHDQLCVWIDQGKAHPLVPTRQAADAIFWEAMGVCGVSLPSRLMLWLGVRAGALIARWTGRKNFATRYDLGDPP